MKSFKLFLFTTLFSLLILLIGCDMFPDRTRPAPVRPNPTRPAPRQQNEAPTKEIPGLQSISEADFMKRISQIETAIKAGNWDKANRETNHLGADMARYRPEDPNGRSLRDVSKFNLIYGKLQANVKTRNRKQALNDIKNLREALRDLDKQ